MLTDKNKHSFCPAKWQEECFDPVHGYLSACSKCPGHNKEELEIQRENMLNGVRDISCNYCWNVEDAGHKSLRQSKIENWNGNLELKVLDAYIGSLCNLQCTYCGPRHSTQWQTDVIKNGNYNLLFDAARINTKARPDTKIQMTKLVQYAENIQKGGTLTILGGEPLINPELDEFLDNVTLDGIDIAIPTNMCFKNKETLSKLHELSATNNITLKPSMDSVTKPISEYIRYGSNQELLQSNVEWVLNNTQMNIEFLSLVTAHTVWGLLQVSIYIRKLQIAYPDRVTWSPEYLHAPVNQSFNILTSEERKAALRIIQTLTGDKIDIIRGALINSKFDYLQRQDQRNFFKQFNERHNITTPQELEFLIEDTE